MSNTISKYWVSNRTGKTRKPISPIERHLHSQLLGMGRIGGPRGRCGFGRSSICPQGSARGLFNIASTRSMIMTSPGSMGHKVGESFGNRNWRNYFFRRASWKLVGKRAGVRVFGYRRADTCTPRPLGQPHPQRQMEIRRVEDRRFLLFHLLKFQRQFLYPSGPVV